MYFISNERDIFPISNDVFNFESKYERRKMYMKKCFYCFYLLIVLFSINNVLRGLKSLMLIDNSHVEEAVLFFILSQKTGNFLSLFKSIFFFIDFIKSGPGLISKILRHSPLNNNMFNSL